MMNKPQNKRLWLISSATVIVALVFFLLWVVSTRESVIEVRVDEKVCYFVEPNFELRWIHSVEKQWWEEQYHRENDGLLLTTTYFEAFGAGTPATEAVAKVKKPGYIGYRINERLPSLNWVVSRLTKGEIDYADHRILIHQWAPDYSEVTITPKAYSIIDRLNKDFCHELQSDESQ
ncbi:DUF1850 domain-containing protein [Psychrobacter sp. CAL346-MNA-CIBAN-0220]|uniref:DUF1850 domain-containing protein n=1 Tax=Psychrobacter sp. CAL346-MNA-CIBAN-0220 TaxID=3140457 RepID=UPI00331FB9A4